MDTVHTDRHLEALTQHVRGGLVVPGASAVADVNFLVDYSSGNTAMSEKLVEALPGQARMRKAALPQAFVGHARVGTSLGHMFDN